MIPPRWQGLHLEKCLVFLWGNSSLTPSRNFNQGLPSNREIDAQFL
jgi:hypothetical protein